MQRNARLALALPDGNGMPWLYKEMVVTKTVQWKCGQKWSGMPCRKGPEKEKKVIMCC
jgi:hypothetical protein